MAAYDYLCTCNENCTANNGIQFYAGETYYIDENYDGYGGEWVYEAFSSTGRFLSWVSYSFLEEFFSFPLVEVNDMFNSIMDG